MTTTTIRIPETLKARLAAAAKRSGTTAHGFILEAIAEKTESSERRLAFVDLAEERFARVAQSGESIAWSDLRRYLEARVAGRKAKRPVPRKLGR
jgi:predicted DNA-binding protein